MYTHTPIHTHTRTHTRQTNTHKQTNKEQQAKNTKVKQKNKNNDKHEVHTKKPSEREPPRCFLQWAADPASQAPVNQNSHLPSHAHNTRAEKRTKGQSEEANQRTKTGMKERKTSEIMYRKRWLRSASPQTTAWHTETARQETNKPNRQECSGINRSSNHEQNTANNWPP